MLEPTPPKRPRLSAGAAAAAAATAAAIADGQPRPTNPAALKKLLMYMQRQLLRHDSAEMFATPVTDAVAPQYSSIISAPMDLSRMRDKLEAGDYVTVRAYFEDVRLMCRNCCVYNAPDTAYFCAARRLWGFVRALQSRERLKAVRRNLGVTLKLPERDLGPLPVSDGEEADGEPGPLAGGPGYSAGASLMTRTGALLLAGFGAAGSDDDEALLSDGDEDGDGDGEETDSTTQAPRWLPCDEETRVSFTDGGRPEQVLEQAQAAASAARRRLLAAPQLHVGFLAAPAEGDDRVAFVELLAAGCAQQPDAPLAKPAATAKLLSDRVPVSAEPRPLDWQAEARSWALAEAADLTLPVWSAADREAFGRLFSLQYEPGVPPAPGLASVFCGLSNDERQALIRTYGDKVAAEYAHSVQGFVRDANCPAAILLAERCLERLTNGQHALVAHIWKRRFNLSTEAHERRLREAELELQMEHYQPPARPPMEADHVVKKNGDAVDVPDAVSSSSSPASSPAVKEEQLVASALNPMKQEPVDVSVATVRDDFAIADSLATTAPPPPPTATTHLAEESAFVRPQPPVATVPPFVPEPDDDKKQTEAGAALNEDAEYEDGDDDDDDDEETQAILTVRTTSADGSEEELMTLRPATQREARGARRQGEVPQHILAASCSSDTSATTILAVTACQSPTSATTATISISSDAASASYDVL